MCVCEHKYVLFLDINQALVTDSKVICHESDQYCWNDQIDGVRCIWQLIFFYIFLIESDASRPRHSNQYHYTLYFTIDLIKYTGYELEWVMQYMHWTEFTSNLSLMNQMTANAFLAYAACPAELIKFYTKLIYCYIAMISYEISSSVWM